MSDQKAKIIFDPQNSNIAVSINNVYGDTTGDIKIEAGTGISIDNLFNVIRIHNDGYVTNGNSHDHNGGDGGQINHTTLSNIGTNTHSQIDTHISNTNNPHNVTPSQIGAALQQDAVPTATIIWTARTTAPIGYLVCEGQAVLRTTYASLFSAIGTLYGSGDGSTTISPPIITQPDSASYGDSETAPQHIILLPCIKI